MTLEQQVCSLPLARRLKELGVKQESVFSWSAREWMDGTIKEDAWHITTTPFRDDIPSFHSEDYDEHIAAFTVAELGELLPTFIDIEGFNRVFETWKEPQGWQCAYKHHSGDGDYALMEALTEADARAKMLIYLLENNLITL